MIILIQPCPFLLRYPRFVPGPAHHKPIVKGVDLPGFVIWKIHVIYDPLPELQFLHRKIQFLFQAGKRFPVIAGQIFHRTLRVPEVLPGHQVCVKIVVHKHIVFVRPGHAADTVSAPFALRKAACVRPDPGGLDEDFRPLFFQVVCIACDLQVQGQGIGDIRVDMVLGGSQRIIGGRLLPVDGAPGEQSAFVMPQNPGPFPGLFQSAVPVVQKPPGSLRLGIHKHRQHIHLRIPEIVSLISLSRQSLGPHSGPAVPSRGLQDMKQVEPKPLLQSLAVLSLNPDIRRVPEPSHIGFLALFQSSEGFLLRFF